MQLSCCIGMRVLEVAYNDSITEATMTYSRLRIESWKIYFWASETKASVMPKHSYFCPKNTGEAQSGFLSAQVKAASTSRYQHSFNISVSAAASAQPTATAKG